LNRSSTLLIGCPTLITKSLHSEVVILSNVYMFLL
jgi:hypothetical protein